MGRGSQELDAATKPYVCVRITDMSNVDLNVFELDFDLTFSAVLMHADGTIYHRYGGREPASPNGYLSLSSLARLLRDTVAEHRRYEQQPNPPKQRPALPAIELPVLQRKIAGGQRIDCVHCHTINDARYVEDLLQGRWRDDKLYVFPDPQRIGITLNREHQDEIDEVIPASAASKAGLMVGDQLLRLGEQSSVRTLSDVQWALHRAPSSATLLPVRIRREGMVHEAELQLPVDWKRCDPADYAWRPYKWNLSPAPGFGGPALNDDDKRKLGISTDQFAMRVGYLVTWGERAHRGQAAKQAGLKKGDIVLSFAGKDDFASFAHLHAWVALTKHAGDRVEIGVLRNGKRKLLSYSLPK